MQQRLADARRDSAARAVALANGKLKRRLRVFRRGRRERLVEIHEFRERPEDVWKAMRY